ncbi:methyltransferase [Clostridium acetobutylicum]|nr:methyltransferase [Clostridium acetobutylicum]
MVYEGIVYRPPSEAYSLIIQITVGCSHNRCSFCSMYKEKQFRIRSVEEIFEDLYEAREIYSRVNKIFLADGDALVIKKDILKKILLKIKELFPECKRIGIYAAPRDILNKSEEDLIELKSTGLSIVYMGIESGNDSILNEIHKGVTSKEIVEAGQKVKKSGIKLSVTLISGIGGKNKIKENAVESAKVINLINPDYIGILTLMVEKGTEIDKKVQKDEFELLSPKENMIEMKELIENINVKEQCVFRSNHASNYASIGGTLPYDKRKMLSIIDDILEGKYGYKAENLRRL